MRLLVLTAALGVAGCAAACFPVAGDRAAWVGPAMPAVAGLLATIAYAWGEGRRRRRGQETWRRWVVGALLVASLGALFDAFRGDSGAAHDRPQVGDLLALLGLLIAAIGLNKVPRPTGSGLVTVRLILDAGLLATCATMLGWVAIIGPAADFASGSPVVVTAVVILLGNVLVASLIGLIAVRELDRWAFIGFVALLLDGVALVATFRTGSFRSGLFHAGPFPTAPFGPHTAPAWANALWVISAPLVVTAVSGYRVGQAAVADRGDAMDRRDARSAAITTSFSLILILIAIAGPWPSPHPPGTPPMGLALLVAILVTGGVREIVAAVARLRLTRRLREFAFEDPLTGLANRRALTSRIAELAAGENLGDASWAVVDLDLDGFKQLNEVLGHETGDEVLLAVAAELRAFCPPGAIAARIGGDEFALLCPGELGPAEALAHDLLHRLRVVLAEHGAGLPLSASVGVGRLAEPPPALTDGERLSALVQSGAALRAAQAAGRNRVLVYSGEVAQARERSRMIERRLPGAVAAEAITVAVQPLVEFSDGSMSGVEALARWSDDVLGVVGPDEFIAVAEQSGGLIQALGAQVLRTSVAQSSRLGLLAAGVAIGVNVSPVQLRNPQFVPLVRAIVEEYAVDPQLLVLEVTEAVLVDEEVSAVALTQLKDLGTRLAIDDFGAGYSALSYLRRIPLDILKIDRAWTVAALTDQRTRDVVATVNDLAHRLGALVVMEGVEDEALAELCRELGADIGQGWYYGRPGSFEAVVPTVLASLAGDAVPAARP